MADDLTALSDDDLKSAYAQSGSGLGAMSDADLKQHYERAASPGGMNLGRGIWTGPEADAWASASMGHVLGAIGQHAWDAWDHGKNLGYSDDVNEWMKSAGIYNDAAKGQGSILRTYNEALIRPMVAGTFGLFGALGRGISAPIAGAQAGAAAAGEELGMPQLGRDIAALPEAFPLFGLESGLHTPHPPLSIPEVTKARDLGLIGEPTRYPTEDFPMGSTARYGGAVKAEVGGDTIRPYAAPIPADLLPPEVAAPASVHDVARSIDPETFSVYDAAARDKADLRTKIAEAQGKVQADALAQAPHQAEIADLERRLEDTTPRLAKKYTARLAEITPERDAFLGSDQMALLTRDTPEIQAMRQELMDADYRMRDLSPKVTAAYREAAQHFPEPAEEPAATPEAPVAQAVVAPEPTAEPPVVVSAAKAEEPTPPAVAAAATPEAAPPLDIRSDVAAKLVAAGRPVEEANAAAALIEAHYEARAARFNGAKGSGADLYARDAPEVRAGRVREMAQRGRVLEQSVYHGSPHIFDKFTLSHIGTGEGAQAYGHGLYFASNKKVAQYYRETLSSWIDNIARHAKDIAGVDLSADAKLAVQQIANDHSIPVDVAARRIFSRVAELRAADPGSVMAPKPTLEKLVQAIRGDKNPGRLYHVDIPDDHEYLDWDKTVAKDSPLRDMLFDESGKHLGSVYADMRNAGRDARLASRNENLTGEGAYRQLSKILGGQAEASKALNEAGIPGIRYLDGSSRRGGEGAHNYVLFDDSRINIREYEQTTRGKISINEGRSVITLMKDANASTFLHETGHAWLEELIGDAKDGAAPDGLRADAATVRKWLGADPEAQITTRQHEKFARGFERYMMEGVAPTQRLAGVFAQFKDWLTKIYQTVERLRAPISDDIRDVFNRLLNTDHKAVIAPDVADETAAIAAEKHSPAASIAVTSDLADLHESDAKTTPPEQAAAMADQIRQEVEQTAAQHAPEVADELAGRGRPDGGTGRDQAPHGGAGGGGAEARTGAGDGGGAGASGALDKGGNGAAGAGDTAPAKSVPTKDGADELVDKAGNIRLDNLNSPDDVKQVLRDLAAQNDDFMVTRGGVISDAARREMADNLGLTVENFTAQKPPGVAPSVWADAVQKLTFQASADVAKLGKVFGDSGSPADGVAYLQAKQRLLLVADHFAGLTAEAGRTLRVFDKEGMSFAGDMVAKMQQDTGRTLFQLQQEAKAVGAMETAAQRAKMVQDTRELTKGEKAKAGIISYFINNLISGPITHAGYSVGNSVWALFKAVPLTAAEATIDEARAMFGHAPADRVYYGEVGAQLYAMWRGGIDGFKPGVAAVKTGISYMEGATRLAEAARGEMLPGMSPLGEAALRPSAISEALQAGRVPAAVAEPVGYALETPSRVVAGIHTVFYAMNYEREIARQAFRTASSEGLTGLMFADRIAEITQNPPLAMVQAAHDEALAGVLMKRPDYGSARQSLASMVNRSLPAKLVMPFMQIGMNILEEGLIKSSPIGLASREVRANLAGRNGAIAQTQQYARIMVGSGLAAGVMGLAAEGVITGGGPSDPREAALKEATGWKAYSLRIGDTYVPYRKYLGPLGPLVGGAANMYDVGHMMGEGQYSKAAGSAVLGFTEVVANETWMSGLSNFIDATRHWDTKGERWWRDTLLSFVPFSSALSQSARVIDQHQREVHAWTDALRNKLPGLSQGLYPQRDWTGREIDSHTMMSPSVARNDPTMAQMQAVEFYPAHLSHEILGVQLNGKQYDDYARVSGMLAKQRLDALVRTAGFADQPAGFQHKAMSDTLSAARKAGATFVLIQPENANILRQANAAREAQAQGKTQAEVKAVRSTAP